MKKSRPVSRILYSPKRTLIIYLVQKLPIESSCLPFNLGRVALIRRGGTLIYMAFHRIEFTWFHYSRTVHTFCCTGPHSPWRTDGCYPLCYSVVSGLSSLITESDKAVCAAKINLINHYLAKSCRLTFPEETK